MDRKYLIKTIKAALPKANQRPLEEAAEIIADMIGMAEEILGDIPMPIQAPTKSPAGAEAVGIPASMPVAGGPPPSVPPATTTTPPAPTRVYYEPNELMAAVNEKMPSYLELKAEGKPDAQAIRSVTAMQEQQGGYFGVQVGYVIPGESSVPKTSFWVTQEDLAIPEAIASLQEQANRIYQFVPRAVVNRQSAPRPGQMKGAEV